MSMKRLYIKTMIVTAGVLAVLSLVNIVQGFAPLILALGAVALAFIAGRAVE